MVAAQRLEVPILRRRLSLAEIKMLPKTAEVNYWEAALYLGVARRTLYNKVNTGVGPRRIEVPGGVLFVIGDLDSWRRSGRTVKEAFSK